MKACEGSRDGSRKGSHEGSRKSSHEGSTSLWKISMMLVAFNNVSNVLWVVYPPSLKFINYRCISGAFNLFDPPHLFDPPVNFGFLKNF